MPQTKEKLAAKKLAKKMAKKPHLFPSQGSAGQSSDSSQTETQEAQAPAQAAEETAAAPSVPPAQPAPLAERSSSIPPASAPPPPSTRAFEYSFAADAHDTPVFDLGLVAMEESHREELYAASLNRIEELTASQTNLQNQIYSKNALIASKDTQLTELETKFAEEQAANAAAQADLKDVNKKLQEALKQIAEVETGKSDAYVKLQHCQDQLTITKDRLVTKTQELKETQEKNETLETKIADLKEGNEVLEETLHHYEATHEHVDKTHDQLSELRQEHTQRGNEIKNLKAELDRYKKAASYNGLAPGHTRRVSSTSLNIGAAQNLQDELGSDVGSEVTDEGEHDENMEDTVKLSKETIQAALHAEANKQVAGSRPSTASTFASTRSTTPPPFETASMIATPKPRKSKIPTRNGDQSGGDSSYPFPTTKPRPLPKHVIMVDSSTSMNTEVTEPLPIKQDMIDKETHTEDSFTQPPRSYTDRDTSTDDSFSHAPRNHSDRGTFTEDSFVLPPGNHKDAGTSTNETFTLPPSNHIDSGTSTDDPFPLPPPSHTTRGTSTNDPFTHAPSNTKSEGTSNPINDPLLHRPKPYADASTSAPRAQDIDQGVQTDFPILQHPDTVLDTTWAKTHYYTFHTVLDPSSIPTMASENLAMQRRLRNYLASTDPTDNTPDTHAAELAEGDETETADPDDQETIRILSLKIPQLSRYQGLAMLPLLVFAALCLWHFVADYRALRAFRDAFAGANTPTRSARAHALHSPGAGVAAPMYGGYGCRSGGFSYYGYDVGSDEGLLNAVIGFLAWIFSGLRWGDDDRVARAQWVVARWFGVSLAGSTGG